MPGQTITQQLEAKLGIDLTGFEKGLNRAVKSAQSVGSRFAKSFGVMRRAARKVAVGVAAIGAATVGLGALAVREFVQWEAAMTGVAKTVDASVETLAALGDEFMRLSEQIPVAATELAAIGEVAGQLGVQVPNLLQFTEVIAALSVSTNLTADAAATSLARLGNIMGTNQRQFGRLGSVIVDLGNNLATTEAEIVGFGTRIAGAGRIAGLTESNVLSIGAALSSVGVQAEAGGTAVQKTLIEMSTAVQKGGEDLKAYADVAGLSAAQFARVWREDAAEGFVSFVEGLGRAGDRAASVLADLGMQDARMVRAFLSLANAGGLLRESVDRGTEAWIQNTALTIEAERFYDRLGARLVELRNKISNTAAEIGENLTPIVDRGIEVMSGFLDHVRDSGPAVEEMATRMATALPGAIESIVNGIGSIGNALLTAVDIITSLPMTAGLGLVGLVFLGPQGAAVLGTIGFVMDAIIEKLGGATTVAEHLEERLRAAIELQATMIEFGETGQAAALGKEIEGFRMTIANLGPSDFAPVNDGFGAWRESLGGVFDMLTQFKVQLGGVGGGTGGGPIGGASPEESQSRLNKEVENTIHLFENLTPQVAAVPNWVREAEAASIDWGETLERVGETIENQILGGLAEIVLNMDSMMGTLKSIGRAIFREITMQLIKAKMAGESLSDVFDAAGPLGMAFGAFGLISQFFAQGGIVQGQGEVPVMAHGGEVVLSRDTVNRMGGPEAANQLNASSFGPTAPFAAAPVPAMAGAGGDVSRVEVAFSMEDIPEPTDYGIIATRPAVARMFSAMLKNYRGNGGTF